MQVGFSDAFNRHAGALGITDDTCYEVVFALAASLVEQADARGGLDGRRSLAGRPRAGVSPLLVSIAGAQGSGKSTLAELLRLTLAGCFNRQVEVLSIDDFYLTRPARQALSRAVHPMLAVRGVPGTHDVELLADVLGSLAAGRVVQSPIFDKARDERCEQTRTIGVCDMAILEGWCWGALPQPSAALLQPVNALERQQDAAGIWRRYVNDALANDYQQLFRSDCHIYLKVPSMEAVYQWRLQQERQLKERQPGLGSQVMNEQAIRAFIAHFERITRWMLSEMPSRADLLIALDEQHHMAGA